MDLAPYIRNVPDFPKKGIQFKDITTLLLIPDAFRDIIDGWKARYQDRNVTVIVAADARGFVFGGALGYAMGLPVVLARRKRKLPAETIAAEYELEYGTAIIEVHADALKKGDRVLIVDDLLATGGTVKAISDLIQKLGAEIVEATFVIELPLLGGRAKLDGIPVHSLVEFMVE